MLLRCPASTLEAAELPSVQLLFVFDTRPGRVLQTARRQSLISPLADLSFGGLPASLVPCRILDRFVSVAKPCQAWIWPLLTSPCNHSCVRTPLPANICCNALYRADSLYTTYIKNSLNFNALKILRGRHMSETVDAMFKVREPIFR